MIKSLFKGLLVLAALFNSHSAFADEMPQAQMSVATVQSPLCSRCRCLNLVFCMEWCVRPGQQPLIRGRQLPPVYSAGATPHRNSSATLRIRSDFRRPPAMRNSIAWWLSATLSVSTVCTSSSKKIKMVRRRYDRTCCRQQRSMRLPPLPPSTAGAVDRSL